MGAPRVPPLNPSETIVFSCSKILILNVLIQGSHPAPGPHGAVGGRAKAVREAAARLAAAASEGESGQVLRPPP